MSDIKQTIEVVNCYYIDIIYEYKDDVINYINEQKKRERTYIRYRKGNKTYTGYPISIDIDDETYLSFVIKDQDCDITHYNIGHITHYNMFVLYDLDDKTNVFCNVVWDLMQHYYGVEIVSESELWDCIFESIKKYQNALEHVLKMQS